MTTIGVIGAMPEEVTLLKNKLSNLGEEKTAGLTVYTGTLGDKNVVLCQSGMGKVNAAAATQLLITKFGIDAIINSGIAGNMTSKIGVGDVVLSKEVMYHDAQLDMIKQAYPFLESYNGNEKLLTAAQKACAELNVTALTGRIATGAFLSAMQNSNRKLQISVTLTALKWKVRQLHTLQPKTIFLLLSSVQ